MDNATIEQLIEEWREHPRYPGNSASSFYRFLRREKGLPVGQKTAAKWLEAKDGNVPVKMVPRKVRRWEAISKDGEIVELQHVAYDVQVDWRSAFREFIEAEIPKASTVSKASTGHLLGVLSITDPHVGKLAWEPEVGEAYDTKRAVDAYTAASEHLVGELRRAGAGHILYVVGNDLLHVDGFFPGTTKGTLQDTDSRWQYAFRRAKNMVVATIERLREFATVDVVIAPGNHDRVLSWALGEVIAAFYREATDVSIDNAPRYRKYKRYEKLLFGITHGDGVKPLALPAIMATEVPEDWGRTTWREWLLGHVHRRREFISAQIDEERGVRMTYLPSLSAQDRWHYENGYANARAAEARVYDPMRGVLLSSSYFFL